MTSSQFTETAEALTTVARRMLVEGESVELPDVGTLVVRHARSTIEEEDHGEAILYPPKDHVVFTPDE